MFNKLTPFQRSLASACCGFFGYGTWAYINNASHGVSAGVKAWLVQGSYSFVLTFFTTILMEKLFQILKNTVNRKSSVTTLTIIITCFCLYLSSWGINVLAATPEIFRTVILGYIVGTVYTVLYVLKLSEQKSP